MTRAVPFAQLLRAAGELAAQGEDADTIAASLRNSHRHATLADTTRAADKAIAARNRAILHAGTGVSL